MLSSKFKTRVDLKKTAGHTDLWQEINQEIVGRSILESLFLFHSLHFEGMDILEGLRKKPIGNCDAKRTIKTQYKLCQPQKVYDQVQQKFV